MESSIFDSDETADFWNRKKVIYILFAEKIRVLRVQVLSKVEDWAFVKVNG